ncbi:MAG: mechanosensitive ion channel family protein [Thermomicrobiales bacterium]
MNIWSDWIMSGVILAGVVALALASHTLLLWIAHRWTARRTGAIARAAVDRGDWPLRAIMVLGGLALALGSIPLDGQAVGIIRHALGLAAIAAFAWMLISLLAVLEVASSTTFDLDTEDNLRARRVLTQIRLLRRVGSTIIIVIAVAAMLMTFSEVRRIGEGLFASAGIAAIIAGIAARPTLSNLIAGIQLAMTEPIRIDDVVIVEGEWGKIEEIGSTYVVVRIWDLRRLIVPLSRFIEQPFENWTRQTANLIGSVYLYADYRVPVDAVREELGRILGSTGLWDGKVQGLQVTDATDRSIELRAIMSARNSSNAWDLRCLVRERLINFLNENYPESLPRTRAEFGSLNGSADRASSRDRRQPIAGMS